MKIQNAEKILFYTWSQYVVIYHFTLGRSMWRSIILHLVAVCGDLSFYTWSQYVTMYYFRLACRITVFNPLNPSGWFKYLYPLPDKNYRISIKKYLMKPKSSVIKWFMSYLLVCLLMNRFFLKKEIFLKKRNFFKKKKFF